MVLTKLQLIILLRKEGGGALASKRYIKKPKLFMESVIPSKIFIARVNKRSYEHPATA
jgi:hypothetical protein